MRKWEKSEAEIGGRRDLDGSAQSSSILYVEVLKCAVVGWRRRCSYTRVHRECPFAPQQALAMASLSRLFPAPGGCWYPTYSPNIENCSHHNERCSFRKEDPPPRPFRIRSDTLSHAKDRRIFSHSSSSSSSASFFTRAPPNWCMPPLPSLLEWP